MKIICNNQTTYIESGKINGHQYVFVFTMIKYCATEILVQPEGHQVFRGVCCHPLLIIYFLYGHTNKTHPLFLTACSNSAPEYAGLLSRVCMGPIVNIVRRYFQFLITNLILFISGWMRAGTLEHIWFGRVLIII